MAWRGEDDQQRARQRHDAGEVERHHRPDQEQRQAERARELSRCVWQAQANGGQAIAKHQPDQQAPQEARDGDCRAFEQAGQRLASDDGAKRRRQGDRQCAGGHRRLLRSAHHAAALAVDTVGTPPFNRDIKEPATGPPITPPITRPIVADVMVRPITPRMP